MFITYLLNPRCSKLRRVKPYQIAQLRIDFERNAVFEKQNHNNYLCSEQRIIKKKKKKTLS